MPNTPFEHLHAIELPTPFPVGPVTVYLTDAPGEPLTLLDTGPLHPPTWSALQAGLAALGYTPAQLNPGKIGDHHHRDDESQGQENCRSGEIEVLFSGKGQEPAQSSSAVERRPQNVHLSQPEG